MNKISIEQRIAVRKSVVDISTSDSAYFTMLILSTVIASYGLLANSTAVVIGAMLVAPLMGPIFGIAMALSIGDPLLLRKATISEILGVLVAVAIATIIGLLPLRLEFGSEIAARIQPTLYDIIIALASGLAGAYAIIEERVSPSLPGVAIATALVPPLATCGLCLSAGKWNLALGAFLLFFANFLAIEIAAAIIFVLSGLPQESSSRPYTAKTFLRRFGLSLLALILVGAFMTNTLVAVVQTRKMRNKVEDTLSRELRSSLGAHLADLRVEKNENRISVIASVLTPREFQSSQVATIEKVLRNVDPRIDLIIRSLISRDSDRSGIVFVEKSELHRAALEREQKEKECEEMELHSRITQVLIKQLRSILGARLEDMRYEKGEYLDTVTALVNAPAVIEPSQVREVEKALQKELGRNIRLIIRSAITYDADSEGFLYEDTFLSRASAIIRKELLKVRGAELVGIKREMREKTVMLNALVNVPQAITPSRVREIERVLRKSMGDFVELTVRSIITYRADSENFIDAAEPSGSQSAPDKYLKKALVSQLKKQGIQEEQLLNMRTGPLEVKTGNKQGKRLVIYAFVEKSVSVTPSIVREIENNLRKYVNPDILLIMRSESGVEASSQEYIQ